MKRICIFIIFVNQMLFGGFLTEIDKALKQDELSDAITIMAKPEISETTFGPVSYNLDIINTTEKNITLKDIIVNRGRCIVLNKNQIINKRLEYSISYIVQLNMGCKNLLEVKLITKDGIELDYSFND